MNTLFFTASPLAAVILVPLYFHRHGIEPGILILFVLGCIGTNLTITASYHRLFAHRSYQTRSWIRGLFLFFGAGAFQGSALRWATDHRRHHRKVDTPEDPYSIGKGVFFAHYGWLFFDDAELGEIPQDLAQDRLIQFQHRHYLWMALLSGVAFPAALGWTLGSLEGGLILLALLRIVATQHSTFLINSFCHVLGRRPYSEDVSARDSVLMAFLTHGEGFHNYHHRFQSDYRNGVRWYHWDPTKWTIQALAAIGLASQLRRVSSFTILQARMKVEEKRLLRRGARPDRLEALRKRVEEAQARFRALQDEYTRRKAAEIRADLQLAKIEFAAATKQWRTYIRLYPKLMSSLHGSLGGELSRL